MTKTRRTNSPLGFRTALAIVLTLALAAVIPATEALADGRIYNPKALRTKKDTKPRGREIRQPRGPVVEPPQQMRSTAKIPSPEPKSRGGSGYTRKGRYFYEQPKPIALRPPKSGSRYGEAIPNPVHPRRRVDSRVGN